MPTPRQNFPNAGHFYSNIVKPIKVDLQWTVNAADTGGLGITSLKSNGYVRNVFMHTSQTPGTNDGALNPNPAAGIVMIQIKNNFNHFLGFDARLQSPVTGSALTATTANVLYQITALGTATLAQWVAAGLPAGITPAVGVAFIAIASATIGGSATVKALTNTEIEAVESVGNTDLTSNNAIYTNGGQYLYLQLLGATNSSTTTLIPTAPPDTTIVSASLWFDASSVTVDGL